MNHAKRMALKLFNYRFVNDEGHVKTANLLIVFEKIAHSNTSARVETMDLWPIIVNQWATQFLKKQIFYRGNLVEPDFYNKNKILSIYRESFEFLLGRIRYTINYRVPSEYAETNFDTVKLLHDDFMTFKHSIYMTRKFDLNEMPVKEAEFDMPPEQPYYEMREIKEAEIVKPKIYEPHVVIESRKGHRGFLKMISYD